MAEVKFGNEFLEELGIVEFWSLQPADVTSSIYVAATFSNETQNSMDNLI